jgi:hypothetical protein
MKLKKKTIQKDSKQKIAIKKMRINIEIKNKLEENYNFFIEM